MKRRLAAWFSFCSLGLPLMLSGCTDNRSAEPATIRSHGRSASGVTFVNPAPTVRPGFCMIYAEGGGQHPCLAKADHRANELAVCTAESATPTPTAAALMRNDNRCGKYVCVVASVPDPTGETFCCKKLCMCDADRQKGFNVDGNGASLPKDSYGVSIRLLAKTRRRPAS